MRWMGRHQQNLSIYEYVFAHFLTPSPRGQGGAGFGLI